jgi:tyrosine-protein phosphatase YwqE
VLSFFRNRPAAFSPLTTDIHSHLLGGLDDGVKSKEQALEIIRVFQELGYKKLITTPHVIHDFYRNDPPSILKGLEELKLYLNQQNVGVEIQAAAEYYLDEELIKKIEAKEQLLTFGKQYFLFETNMVSEPYQLKDFIFKLTTVGYKPVLAHPERYAYMTLELAEDLRNRGVLLQMNILSIIGYYSKPIQRLAQKLIDQRWIDLLGSDCHHLHHARLLAYAQEDRYFRKALALPLLNHTL